MSDKDIQERVKKLTLLEHQINNLLEQKQQFHSQLHEIATALKEVEHTKKAYKIIGNIMAESPKEQLQKELGEKKEMLDIRINTIDKQEKQFKEEAQALREEVSKE